MELLFKHPIICTRFTHDLEYPDAYIFEFELNPNLILSGQLFRERQEVRNYLLSKDFHLTEFF